MKLFHLYTVSFLLLLLTLPVYAQGYLSYQIIPKSSFLVGDSLYGMGSMQLLSAHYSFPLILNQGNGDKTAHSTGLINLDVNYAQLNHSGKAKLWHPKDVINGVIHVTKYRQLCNRWTRIIIAGIGCYASTQEISIQSFQVNGAMLFVYSWPKGIHLGIGGGISHSFGFPLLLPLFYFSWKTTNICEWKLDMSNGLKISASYQLAPYIQIDGTILEISGMAAVLKQERKSKLYSMTSIRSFLTATWNANNHLDCYLGFGGNWIREIRITDRNLKGFLEVMKKPQAENLLRYKATPFLTAGLRIKL